MYVPVWLVVAVLVLFGATATWLSLILAGRNPLPFPDVGSRIFTAATPAAKATIIDLLAQYGVRERFQVNTNGVLRSIMWDGTIINCPDPEVTPSWVTQSEYWTRLAGSREERSPGRRVSEATRS
jgi:hypothetical protein